MTKTTMRAECLDSIWALNGHETMPVWPRTFEYFDTDHSLHHAAHGRCQLWLVCMHIISFWQAYQAKTPRRAGDDPFSTGIPPWCPANVIPTQRLASSYRSTPSVHTGSARLSGMPLRPAGLHGHCTNFSLGMLHRLL